MAGKSTTPGLFGQKHSSRDYSKAECWGKNQFNSSFPASLVAYMYSKGMMPVYIKTNQQNEIIHTSIKSKDLLGIDPLSEDAYYNYEAGFAPYEKFYQGEREKIDLVMMNNTTNELLSGLEVKLTALPDNTTKKLPETEWKSLCARQPSASLHVASAPTMKHWKEKNGSERCYATCHR